MVLQHQPLQLLMAPSGVDKGQVPADQLIVVDGQGKISTGKGKASAETALHLRIVKATQAGAVLHTHSVAGTVLSRHYENSRGCLGELGNAERPGRNQHPHQQHHHSCDQQQSVNGLSLIHI